MPVIINGSTGITNVNGSASTPAETGTDTDTGIYYGTNTVGLATNGTNALFIDASQNVGLGTSSPTERLTIAGIGRVTGGNAFNASGPVQTGNLYYGWEMYNVDTTRNYLQSYNRFNSTFMNSVYNALSHQFFISGGEQMRIDSSGIVLVGATSARTTQAKIELTSAANTALSFYMYKTSQVEMAMGFKSSTDTNFYIGTGSTSVGTNGVYLTNTGSSWNAVSDERMKTILEPITNAAEKVSSLRAVIGYYNNDESQIRRPFLIAQDVQKVLPEAVNVQDQETGTLGMSYTDTIPLLVAAIQEQQALITALTARIEALEAK